MSGEHYVNFDILLERVHDRYEAKVIRSPVGETPTRMFDMPLSDIELRNVVLELRNAPELARDVPIAAAPGSDLVREIGSRMFDCIFRDEMLSCLHRSIDYVGWHHNAGLRVRLHFSEAPELARLPWEMLFDRTSRNFLGLTQRTPLVRYIELPQVSPPRRQDGPLRMVVLISSPVDYPKLDVQRELAIVEEATRPLVRSGRLVVESLPEPTLEALERAGRRPYHILHYVGHGGVLPGSHQGVLVLCDAAGRGQLEPGVDLGQQLRDVESLQLVVLNSCRGANVGTVDPFGGTAESLVLQGVPAVIAMQFEISDRAALKFAQSLYEALADGRPVDAAVTQARRTLHAAARAEWATPVLHMRTPDGQLFGEVPARLIAEPRPRPSPEPPSPQPLPPPPPVSTPGSTVLALSPLGLLTMPLPFLVWAINTGRRDLWLRAVVYIIATIGIFLAAGLTPTTTTDVGTTEPGDTAALWGFGMLALITAAVIDAFRVRRWIGDPSRRSWGREVAARYPEEAAQWRIGRPDLTGGRIDGGLVDVNHASSRAMRSFLGISRSEAHRVELARARLKRLQGPGELATQAGIPEPTIDRIADRLLFL